MSERATLKRAISLPLLVFYGAGTILGAGIYALIGEIAALSGRFAPFSFLLSAVIAAFVAFTYAELSGRFPKSAGEAVYVAQAFRPRWLTALVGWAIVLTGVVSSAVMARGFYGYLNEFVPLPDYWAISAFVLVIAVIAVAGISLSVSFAALVTLIEISGIILVLYVSRGHLLAVAEDWRSLLPPMSWPVWRNIVFGAFLAFYAFIGFEDMVNVAEEVIEPERNLPVAIVMALSLATVFYVLVSLAAVMTLPVAELAAHRAPFALIVESNSEMPPEIISLISLIAILNGALVQIVMGSRVMYGLSENGLAPKFFAVIHRRTRTPVGATVGFSLVLLLMALWLPIAELARITSFIILFVFAMVSLSLCVLKTRERVIDRRYFRVPLPVPVISFVICLGFIVLQFQ